MAGDQGRPACADRRADRLGQDAGRVSRRDRRAGAARARRPASPDETQIVYVSPLKALSNDIQQESRSPARRHPRGACGAQGLPDVEIRTWVRTGDTPPGERDRDAPPAAAHPRDDAGIALHPARLRIRPRRCWRRRADRHRRRDPRGRAEQARLASRAVAGAARRAVRRPAAAHRPVGDAEADRGGRALSGRRRAASERAGMHDHRHRPPPRARSRARSAVLAARSGHVGRGLGGGLRPARRADRGAPHDAGLRQHAPHGRARHPRICRSGSAPSRSPRITAASPRSAASTPSSG